MYFLTFKEKITTNIVPVIIEISDYGNSYGVYVNNRPLTFSYSKEFTIEQIITDVEKNHIRQSDL